MQDPDDITLEAFEARQLSATMTDMSKYYSLCSAIGECIIEDLNNRGINTDFLSRPLPVSPGNNPILLCKSNLQEQAIKDALFKRSWEPGFLDEASIKAASRYQDPAPIRTAKMPEAPWFQIMTKALSVQAQKAGLNIDLSKAPFFIGFVSRPIANEVAKSTLFLEHPASGNITHGVLSHPLQLILAASPFRIQ